MGLVFSPVKRPWIPLRQAIYVGVSLLLWLRYRNLGALLLWIRPPMSEQE